MKTLKKLTVAMMVFLATFVVGIRLLNPAVVYAATLTSVDKMISLGMSDVLARFIGGSLLNVNSSGNLVLPVASGKKLSVTVAGTEKASLSSAGLLTTAGGQTMTTGDETATAGDFIALAVSKGLVAGETARAANVTTATTAAAPVYVSGAAASYDLAAYVGSGVSASGPSIDLFKTRATSGAATTIVNVGDTLGQFKFFGANGTTYDPAAAIIVTSDAAPGAATDMPGAIDFQTTPDGSVTLASVLKLKNDKSANFTGAIKSTATTLGWQVRAGANTACNTTCTAAHGCVFGQDTGSANIMVDCTNAAADVCLCTF